MHTFEFLIVELLDVLDGSYQQHTIEDGYLLWLLLQASCDPLEKLFLQYTVTRHHAFKVADICELLRLIVLGVLHTIQQQIAQIIDLLDMRGIEVTTSKVLVEVCAVLVSINYLIRPELFDETLENGVPVAKLPEMEIHQINKLYFQQGQQKGILLLLFWEEDVEASEENWEKLVVCFSLP